MGLFNRNKKTPEEERREEIQSDLEAVALNVKTAIQMEDDYWLNELLDKAHTLSDQEPALEVPQEIIQAEKVMQEYGRRIENIREKMTLSQYLEVQAAAKEETEDEEE